MITIGLFDNNRVAVANHVYNDSVKPTLNEKDGFTHVVMINSFSKWINQNFER